MSETPAAWLARLKVAFPYWSIDRVPPGEGGGFTARRRLLDGRSQSLHAPTLAELEHGLWIAARAGPTGSGVDAGRQRHADRLARYVSRGV
jgi:hypothetical protein